ncbi:MULTISPECIES: endonuclease/exonuclease/phosphatase family protein [Tsukamurella]|uniref:Endonuclease/exonuclease/phosphatase family protein n=2 Tax=Tsukamurella TaxID=2060 RepID=A0A5C5S237_9ACTN|nr:MULTISPECIES: endonuclease/exonuclease/phosphatase family protein [Tsukamurella]NMD54973.1 endonuclease/exonuclease/phosphatase family protein [Tsukamurella columbiensis]TWS29496.1 endonuclease/exonuclease/phosphatase family protein [Tsukamurella conjunctivitidis]
MRFFFRTAASIVGTAALLGALLALVLHFWPGTDRVTVAAAAVSPVLWLALVAIAAVCLLYVRALLRLVLVAAVAAAGIWVQAPLWRGEPAPANAGLTVLTANIQVGAGDADALATLVRENRVDVLAVLEVTDEAAQRIAASTIGTDLPHSLVRPAALANGTALYSRHPLASTGVVPGFVMTALTAVATVPGRGDVQLFALHPTPPLDADTWDSELRRIGTLLQGVPEGRPVVALGDYNATYDHVRFRSLLSHGYRDAGQLAGAGWLPTYPTDKGYPPVVGIDHVLLRGLGAAEVTAHDIRGADHRAVLARVG